MCKIDTVITTSPIHRGVRRVPRIRPALGRLGLSPTVFLCVLLLPVAAAAADPWPGDSGTQIWSGGEPSGIVWHEGRVYVADAINDRIQVFGDTGQFEQVLGNADRPLTLHYPYDLVLGSDGDLYTVEYGAGRISRIATDGKLLGRFGATGTEIDQFVTPWGIAIDPEGQIYVADTGNRRIARLSR